MTKMNLKQILHVIDKLNIEITQSNNKILEATNRIIDSNKQLRYLYEELADILCGESNLDDIM